MALLKSFYDGYRDLMDNHADPRTTNWPLMSSPFPTMAISLCYAYFAKVRLKMSWGIFLQERVNICEIRQSARHGYHLIVIRIRHCVD